jgi:hypothetical protein
MAWEQHVEVIVMVTQITEVMHSNVLRALNVH